MTDPRINSRIREIRKAENLNQTEFAAICDCHQTVIARIEKGERDLTIEMVLNLCRKLGYRSDYVLLGDLPKKRTDKTGDENISSVMQDLKTEMEVMASKLKLMEKAILSDKTENNTVPKNVPKTHKNEPKKPVK